MTTNKAWKIEKVKEQFSLFWNNSKEVEDAILSATKLSWSSGSEHYALLIHENSYEVLWSQQYNNNYSKHLARLYIPGLEDEDYDTDPDLIFYENCKDYLFCSFEQLIEDIKNYEEEFVTDIDEFY
jgi:hypothetical protein